MDVRLARVLFQHEVDYGLPAVVGVPEVKCVIEQSDMPFDDFLVLFMELLMLVWVGFRIDSRASYVGLGMSQMHPNERRSGCPF